MPPKSKDLSTETRLQRLGSLNPEGWAEAVERFTQLEERKHDLAIGRLIEVTGACVAALEDPYVETVSAEEFGRVDEALRALQRRIDRFLSRPAGGAGPP